METIDITPNVVEQKKEKKETQNIIWNPPIKSSGTAANYVTKFFKDLLQHNRIQKYWGEIEVLPSYFHVDNRTRKNLIKKMQSNWKRLMMRKNLKTKKQTLALTF